MKVLINNNTLESSNLFSNLANRNAVNSDQAVDKNDGNPSLLISFLELSNEVEDDRSTDLFDKNKSRTLLASQEVVVIPDSVCGT